jgi:integrase
MAVVRDSTGRWRYRKQIRLTKERTIRISGTPVLNTKLEAEKAEREHIQRVLTAPPGEPSLEPKEVPTFDAFADEFMATYAKTNNRFSEQMAKLGILKHHLRPAFGKLKLDAITVREIEQLKAKVLAAELSRKRANNIVAVLSKILHYARDIGILESVPTVKLLKLPPAKFDFLTFDELESLLDGAAVEPIFRAAILVGAEAGLRMGEIIGLEWEDVDFRNRTLTVMRSEWQGHVGPPKGGRARTIPLTERLIEALKGERHLRGPRVFCLEGGEHWHRHNMRKGLDRACRRAKLRTFGWHVLRHTFCSHLAMRGAVPKAIQELAGHTTLAVTLRYMHLAPSALRDAIQLLDRPTWQNRAKTGEPAEGTSAQMGAK